VGQPSQAQEPIRVSLLRLFLVFISNSFLFTNAFLVLFQS
jgi:hypothetical protein